MSNPLPLPVKRLPHAEGLPLPAYQTDSAACIDLIAAIDADLILEPGRHTGVPTGMCFAIPDGYHGQIWGRSGLAFKHGIAILGGMIDSDYRGEIKVMLINHGEEPFMIKRGDRIAQFLIAPYAHAHLMELDSLPETNRGESGFGSTGK